MKEGLHFISLLKSPVSWAKAGRETVTALVREGHPVSAVSLKGYRYDEAYPLAPEVLQALSRPRSDGWDVALDYPPNFARLNGRRRAGIVIYECDRLPTHWVEAINTFLDLVIVPSEFSRDAAARSGVDEERIRVAPFGVDTEIYRPDGPGKTGLTGKAFNFLTVGAPHIRKGLAEVAKAFCAAFGPADDVGLVIKCPPIGTLGRRPWEYVSVADFLPDAGGGRIGLVEGAHSENEMAALYRVADVYVQASYGESFGLAAMEAAACGVPVITTNWGAAAEIFAESAYLAKYDLFEAGAISYDWKGAAPVHAARPRVESLSALMRRAWEDAAERKEMSRAALARSAQYTWQRTAELLVSALC